MNPLQALQGYGQAERDRRVLRVHLGPDVAAGLATLQAAIAEALAS